MGDKPMGILHITYYYLFRSYIRGVYPLQVVMLKETVENSPLTFLASQAFVMLLMQSFSSLILLTISSHIQSRFPSSLLVCTTLSDVTCRE